MKRLLVLLVLAACSAPPASSAPDAPAPATSATTPPEPAEDPGAGFASPKQADEPPVQESGGPPDPKLDARVKERFGERCRYERACGDLVGVDCDAAVDGPYYYVTRKKLTVVSTCGGACMSGRCTDCPPKAWTCKTY